MSRLASPGGMTLLTPVVSEPLATAREMKLRQGRETSGRTVQ
jgi:hypothetical protein